MSTVRIRELVEFGGGYGIDEVVTKEGHWITWTDLFDTRAGAVEYLLKRGYKEVEFGFSHPRRYEKPSKVALEARRRASKPGARRK